MKASSEAGPAAGGSGPVGRWIVALCAGVGRASAWLIVLIVLAGSWNALARYAGKGWGIELSANALQDAQWYLFSLVFLLGAAWTLQRDEHVRVDVLYQRFSPRTRAWINLAGHTLFLIPFCLVMLWASWPLVRDAWLIHEQSPDPGGLPRYPIKAALPLGFLLLLAQGLVSLARELRVVRGRAP